MIIVTGGAGFIGSNLVHALCSRGEDVVVVDDLRDGHKFANVAGADIADYLDMEDFYAGVRAGGGPLREARAVFHQGACSDTTEWDGRHMMRVNYECSKALLHACAAAQVPFIYASSAAVYGSSSEFREVAECERPINVYGYSKHLFDRYVRRGAGGPGQVAGLRYFNVYGPREEHKGRMASVAFHFDRQLLGDGEVRLFEGCDGFGDGEQRRDFVHVDDVVAVNMWLLDNPRVSGIFNVGTGASGTFNEVAQAVLAWHGTGRIRYVPFPDDLKGRYQSFTQASLDALRAAGFDGEFMDVSTGVARYLDWLHRDEQRGRNDLER